jgi:FlaA1/EpsC-like NDP-sugar epimerase
MAYRHEGFFYAMDTYREYQHLNELWARRRSLEGLGLSGFWQDRGVLVTGATGMAGSWLTRRMVEAGADVVCLVRDWVPQCELMRTGMLDRVKVVRGDLCDREVLERAIGEYETGTVIHLAAQTIVGIANRNPVSTFESNIQGTWNVLEACRRSGVVKSKASCCQACVRSASPWSRGPRSEVDF